MMFYLCLYFGIFKSYKMALQMAIIVFFIFCCLIILFLKLKIKRKFKECIFYTISLFRNLKFLFLEPFSVFFYKILCQKYS